MREEVEERRVEGMRWEGRLANEIGLDEMRGG